MLISWWSRFKRHQQACLSCAGNHGPQSIPVILMVIGFCFTLECAGADVMTSVSLPRYRAPQNPDPVTAYPFIALNDLAVRRHLTEDASDDPDDIFSSDGLPRFPDTIEARSWHPVHNSIYARGMVSASAGISLPSVVVLFEGPLTLLDHQLLDGGYKDLVTYTLKPSPTYRVVASVEFLHRRSNLLAPYFAFGIVWEHHLIAADTTYNFSYFEEDEANNYSERHELRLDFMRIAGMTSIGIDIEPYDVYPLTGLLFALDHELGLCTVRRKLTTVWLPHNAKFTSTSRKHSVQTDRRFCNAFGGRLMVELFGQIQIGVQYVYNVGSIFTNSSGFVSLEGDTWYGTLTASF